MAWTRLDEIKRSIVCALGLSTAMIAGCSNRPIDDNDSVGDGDGSDSSADSGDADSGTSGGSTSGDGSISGSGSGDGDTGGPSTCVADPDAPSDVAFCVPAPPDGACGPCDDATCQQAALAAGNEAGVCICGCGFVMQTCGPEAVGDECCYKALVEDQGCIGRPFIVDGIERQALAVQRTDWASALQPDTAVPPAIAETLAAHWQRVALAEHASVASFARLCLDLLSLGAPPELLARTQRAMADEIEHARLGFALASAYANRAIGPGGLETHDANGGSRDAAAILRDAIIEGCIGETVSAAEATAAAEATTDPVVRRVLAKIAADETRHAALAWRFVQWLLEQQPDLRNAADACFRDACRERPHAVEADWMLESYGVLSDRARASVRREALREIVEPCARVLVSGTRTDTAASHCRT